MSILLPLGVLGLALTLYAIYVKNKSEEEKNYKPYCDINKHISCTKAFKSKYFTVFYFPNTVYGLFYYITVIILSYRLAHFIFYVSIPAVIFSLYLAYLSYFKQKNFCLVCTATYIISFMLLYYGWVIELQ